MKYNEILLFFAKRIESELGIVYADHNYFQLENRLLEIANLLDIESLEKLYEHAQKGIDGQFHQMLMDLATNNETSFFRDAKIFRCIEQAVLATFRTNHPHSTKLRIWSAAASSGQEALSVAMTVFEWNQKQSDRLDFEVLGTDISERILKKAQSARYSQLEIQRGLPAPLMLKYFAKDADNFWTPVSDLRGKIEFRRLNLKENFVFAEKFHLILCRNVLIYQTVQGKKEIIKRLFDSLAPGGFLVLGAGESLIGLSDAFAQTQIDGSIIYQKAYQNAA